MTRIGAGLLTCAVLVASAGAMPALAAPKHDRHEAQAQNAPPHGRGARTPGAYRGREPREWAAERARRSSRGGRVLSAEPAGKESYRVRVLTPDGYIRNLVVDPRREDD